MLWLISLLIEHALAISNAEIITDNWQVVKANVNIVNDTVDNEIIVDCTPTFMCISFAANEVFFERNIIKEAGFTPEDFDFPQPCNGKFTRQENSSTYCIESGYLLGGTCGLAMNPNKTHVAFTSQLEVKEGIQGNYVQVRPGVFELTRPIIPFTCIFPLDEYVRTEFKPVYTPPPQPCPETGCVGEAMYPAEMLLYKSSQYETAYMGNPTYNPFDFSGRVTRVNAEVRLMAGTASENIAIQINDCWATPTPDPFDSVNKNLTLVKRGCPNKPATLEEEMNTAVLISGEDTFARFQFDVFAFASSPKIYLHCRAEVCYNTDTFSCRKSRESCDVATEDFSRSRMRRSINEFGIVSEVEELNEVVVSAGPLTVRGHHKLNTVNDLIHIRRVEMPSLDFMAIRIVSNNFLSVLKIKL